MAGAMRWISTMKSTACSSTSVSMPARSPGRSTTGPAVARIHAGEHGDRQLRSDAADANEPLEQLTLQFGQKAVQLQRVFAHVRVNTQSDVRACLAGVVKRRQRNVDLVANALDVDDQSVRLLVCDAAAKKSDHPCAGGLYCRHERAPVGRTLPGPPGRA